MKPTIIAFDCETTGLNPRLDKLLCLSVAWVEDGEIRSTYYEHGGAGNVFPWPTEWLSDPEIIKVAHNARFDIKFLHMNGYTVSQPYEDTMLLAQVLDENQQMGLKPLVKKHLGAEHLNAQQELVAHLKALKLKMSDLGDPRVDQNIVRRYCNEDTENTLRLYLRFKASVNADAGLKSYYEDEMIPVDQVLLDMELRGNRIDISRLDIARVEVERLRDTAQAQLKELLTGEISTIEEDLWEKEKAKFPKKAAKGLVPCPVFNWNSGPQKVMLFYGRLGLGQYVREKTESGAPSMGKKTLQNARIPEGIKLAKVLKLHFEYQSYHKLHSAYIEGITSRLEEGRIYGQYCQASQESAGVDDSNTTGGTVTGRLSHRDPNLGNLPRKQKEATDYYKGTFVKDLFIPEEGYTFAYADYSQIELRVATFLSHDRGFERVFAEGGDPHTNTASEINIPRQQAKTVNFLLIYGGSAWRLAHELGLNPEIDRELRQAEVIRNDFFAKHNELYRWNWNIKQEAQRTGFLRSYFGRCRRLPDLLSYDMAKKKSALKKAGNFVVQSVAASICKRAMVDLHAAGFKIVNQVHDSITCMVPIDGAEMKLKQMCDIMEAQGPRWGFTLPMSVEGKLITTFKE